MIFSSTFLPQANMPGPKQCLWDQRPTGLTVFSMLQTVVSCNNAEDWSRKPLDACVSRDVLISDNHCGI